MGNAPAVKTLINSLIGVSFVTAVINKFLETNDPRGRAIGVFTHSVRELQKQVRSDDSYRHHFGLKAQKPKFIYYTSPKTAIAVLTSPQGEVEAETPRQSLEELC